MHGPQLDLSPDTGTFLGVGGNKRSETRAPAERRAYVDAQTPKTCFMSRQWRETRKDDDTWRNEGWKAGPWLNFPPYALNWTAITYAAECMKAPCDLDTTCCLAGDGWVSPPEGAEPADNDNGRDGGNYRQVSQSGSSFCKQTSAKRSIKEAAETRARLSSHRLQLAFIYYSISSTLIFSLSLAWLFCPKSRLNIHSTMTPTLQRHFLPQSQQSEGKIRLLSHTKKVNSLRTKEEKKKVCVVVCNYFMAVNIHSSNQPHERGRSSTPGCGKVGRAQAGGRADLRLFHPSYLSSHISCCQFVQEATARWFLLVREATLATRHRPVATRCVLQWLAKVPKSLGSEMKTCCQNMLPSAPHVCSSSNCGGGMPWNCSDRSNANAHFFSISKAHSHFLVCYAFVFLLRVWVGLAVAASWFSRRLKEETSYRDQHIFSDWKTFCWRLARLISEISKLKM